MSDQKPFDWQGWRDGGGEITEEVDDLSRDWET